MHSIVITRMIAHATSMSRLRPRGDCSPSCCVRKKLLLKTSPYDMEVFLILIGCVGPESFSNLGGIYRNCQATVLEENSRNMREVLNCFRIRIIGVFGWQFFILMKKALPFCGIFLCFCFACDGRCVKKGCCSLLVGAYEVLPQG